MNLQHQGWKSWHLQFCHGLQFCFFCFLILFEPKDVQSYDHVTDRIGDSCSLSAIALYQGATSPLPNGIPTYTVQILNVCISGCTVSNIHVSCGWFSSARMINPRIFRRMRYNDCLVNDGGPLAPGGSLSFEYANTFRYPLSVTDLRCY